MTLAARLRHALPALLLLPAMAAGGCSLHIQDGYSFDFEGSSASRSEEGSITPGTEKIVVDNRFGEVTVEGVDGPPGWQWDLETWADDQVRAAGFLDEVRLQTSQDGRVARWRLILPERGRRELRGVSSNLRLRVPRAAEVVLENDFGNASISGVGGGTTAEVAYGDLVLRGLEGAVEADSSFGELDAENLPAGARLHNSYGPVSVRGARGSLEIENDFGAIEVHDAAGGVRAENSYGPVHLENVGGRVVVENSFDSVTIIGNPAGVECDNSYGPVTIRLLDPGECRVRVDNSFGEILVELPPGAEPRLEASASFGEVDSEVQGPGNQASASGGKISLGRTQAPIQLKLKTSHANVLVRSTGS